MAGVVSSPGDALASRRVLVTGHTGFMGSWLALWLAELGCEVTGYALAPATEPSNFVVSGVETVLAAHHVADVRDDGELEGALRSSRPEVVFHLAAQALVREGYRAPADTFDVNVMGTCRLLDCIRRLGRPCVVIVFTSDKCYENREDGRRYREADRLGGRDPYSASKAAAEIAAASYASAFFPPGAAAEHGVRLATLRAGNVIGGGDWAADRIIPDAVRALSSGLPVPVRSPSSVRPWQHVLEPLGGALGLAAGMLGPDGPALAGAWNFGPEPGPDVTVRELVELFIAAWGEGSWEDRSDSGAPREAETLRLDAAKATEILGWRPRWSAAEAVERASRWYRRFYSQGGSMREACLEEIAEHSAGGAS